MSQLNIDTLRAKTAGVQTPAIYPVRGSDKLFCTFAMTSATIYRSLNVAGIIDDGVGNFRVNCTSNFAYTEAPAVFSSAPVAQYNNADFTSAVVTNYIAVQHAESGALTDTAFFSARCGGDLA